MPLKTGRREYAVESAFESVVECTGKLTIKAQSKVYDGTLKLTAGVHRDSLCIAGHRALDHWGTEAQ